MTTLSVPDMSCGHCKAAVEQALAGVAPGARVSVDLAARRVQVDGATVPVAALVAALDAVGFSASASPGA